MLTRQEILNLLQDLDAELAAADIQGEICIYGGTFMCLVFHSRPATKDVDAVFKPASAVRDAAAKVAAKRDLPHDWLNDALKGFLADHPRKPYIELPHLRVFVPETDYMLAMKSLAARFDTSDRDDVIFLIGELGLDSPDAVFSILEKYYPADQIRPATRFFIEEIFQRQ